MVIPITTPRETLTCNVTNISSSTHPTYHYTLKECGQKCVKWYKKFAMWMQVTINIFLNECQWSGLQCSLREIPQIPPGFTYYWHCKYKKPLKTTLPWADEKKFPQLDKLNEVCNTMYWPYKDQKASNCICWYIKLSFLT